MAYYHKNLKYHEDVTEKHSITSEEVKFLAQLQREMNTQETVGQADPRYWVIKGSERIYRVNQDVDGFCLYDNVDGKEVANNLKSAFEFIRDELLPDINESTSLPVTIKFEPSPFLGEMGEIIIENGDECFEDLDEIEEWLNDNSGDTYGKKYEFISYECAEKIYSNTLFLTQKAAEKHLRANYYHYSDDAHTYAMTSWRNAETEQLWKIISSVDWSEIAKTVGANKGTSACWYQECWYDSDLESALEAKGIPVCEENIQKMREVCKGIFDDKSERNEMLKQMAEKICL